MNQFYKAYAVAIASLLTGAAVVHNIYKPDLVSHLTSQFFSASFALRLCWPEQHAPGNSQHSLPP